MTIHQCSICGQSKAKHEFRWNPKFGVRTECRECEKSWLRCSQCKAVKAHEDFPEDKRIKTGRHSVCNDCHLARMQAKYHGSEEYRKQRKEHSRGDRAKAWRRQYWQKVKGSDDRKSSRREYMKWLYHGDPIHRLKIKARSLVNHAINTGKLKKPEACEVCGKTGVNLDGHHYAGYWPRVTWLMLQWLCDNCHAKADMEQGKDKLFIGFGLPELAEIESKLNSTCKSLGLDQEGILKATIECQGEDECEVFLNVIKWLKDNGYKVNKPLTLPPELTA